MNKNTINNNLTKKYNNELIKTYKHNKPSILGLISSFIAIFLVSQCIVLGVLINKNLSNINFAYTDNFGYNWKTTPVDSLNIRSKNDIEVNCYTGSSDLLSNVNFPGFKSGCFCPPDKYYDTDCNDNQLLLKNCTFYPESPSKPVYSWSGSLCGYRNTNNRLNNKIHKYSKNINKLPYINYFNLNKTESTKPCEKGYKECGILDTLGNKLCIYEKDYCPINYIEIVDSNKKLNYKFTTKSILLSNSNKTLHYSNNNTKGNIVNEFIVLDHVPCADPSENKIQLNLTKYKCINKINNKTYDDNWHHLDDKSLDEFIDDNELGSHIKNYPFYNIIKNKTLSLYYRSYIGINQTCTKSSYLSYNKIELPNLFINFQHSVNTSYAFDLISPSSIISLIIVLFSLIFKIYLICNYKSNYSKAFENPNIFVGNYNCYLIYCNTTASVSCVLLLVISLVSTISIGNLRNIYTWFFKLSYCSDKTNHELFEIFDSDISAAYALAVVSTLIILLLFFLVMLDSFIKRCKDEVPYYDENEQYNTCMSNSFYDNNKNNTKSDLINKKEEENEDEEEEEEDDEHDVLIDNFNNMSINDIEEDNETTDLINKKNK